MQLTEHVADGVVTVSASGRIDHQTAEAFQAALEPHLAGCSAEGSAVVIDMAGVDYVSSVGLRVLLMASKRATAQKGKIGVAAMQPTVAEVFQISHFHRILPAFDTVDAAVAGLQG